jgi:hypothetical protein
VIATAAAAWVWYEKHKSALVPAPTPVQAAAPIVPVPALVPAARPAAPSLNNS